MDARAITEADTLSVYLMSEFHCHVLILPSDVVRFHIQADPSHWIYISREFLSDTNGGATKIIEMIEAGDLIEALENADSPQYRAIERNGICVVDDTYAK